MKDIFIGGGETVFYPDSSNFRIILQKDKYQIDAHWHPCIEILLIFSGDYFVEIEEEPIHLTKGDILIIHSGTVHAFTACCKGTRLIFQFDIELLYSQKEFQTLLFTFPPYLLLSRNSKHAIYQKLLEILMTITTESQHKNLLWEARLYSLVLHMYTLLFRSPLIQMQSFPVSEKKATRENLRYQKKFLAVCQYINQNLSDSLTLESVASYAGFSKFHFSRLFKDFAGISFSHYLIHQKVQKAKLLLLTTDASITDIALESGFNSSSTFNRSFSAEEDMSPSDFRIKHSGTVLFP